MCWFAKTDAFQVTEHVPFHFSKPLLVIIYDLETNHDCLCLDKFCRDPFNQKVLSPVSSQQIFFARLLFRIKIIAQKHKHTETLHSRSCLHKWRKSNACFPASNIPIFSVAAAHHSKYLYSPLKWPVQSDTKAATLSYNCCRSQTGAQCDAFSSWCLF